MPPGKDARHNDATWQQRRSPRPDTVRRPETTEPQPSVRPERRPAASTDHHRNRALILQPVRPVISDQVTEPVIVVLRGL
jgi:hypothetical protein